MTRPILVTGGAGFIGSNLVHFLHESQENPIIVLDKLTYAGNVNSISSLVDGRKITFHHTDIGDRVAVHEIFESANPIAVFNLAAESHVDRSIDKPAEFIQTNVVGTTSLLEVALAYYNHLDDESRSGFRFIHVSTDEVYGSLGHTGLFSEDHPFEPNSPYAASKAASDHFVRAYHQTFGLPVITTNCSNNYGPYQFREKLIPLMIQKAIRGESLPVYGDGSNIRDWLHVEDHCRALWSVYESGRVGETYNIGGNCEMTNLDVVHRICAALEQSDAQVPVSPISDLITFVNDRPGHDQRYAVDTSKISAELNWDPIHTFESGLRDTVNWYLDNQMWIDQVTDGSYRLNRLGLSERTEVSSHE